MVVLVIFGLALVVQGGLVTWYASRILGKYARLLSFLDVQDIDRRRARAEDLRVRELRHKALDSFFKDTRAILGKLFAIAEELSPHQRDTVEMPGAPEAPTSRDGLPETLPRPDAHPVSRQRLRPERGMVLSGGPSSARSGPTLPETDPAPTPIHERAAGLGRPRVPTLPTVLPPPRKGSTLTSMPTVGAPSSKGDPHVSALKKCSACDNGLVRLPNRGIDRCAACGGLGEVEVEPERATSPSSAGPPAS